MRVGIPYRALCKLALRLTLTTFPGFERRNSGALAISLLPSLPVDSVVVWLSGSTIELSN